MAKYLITNGDGGDVVLAGLNNNADELYDAVELTNKVLVTGTLALDDTAFGEIHICSGTSADYTVTLPTAVGNEGKMIAFKGDSSAAILNKVITIDGASTEVIDSTLTKLISTGGYMTIVARVTAGVGHWDVISFDQGAFIPITLGYTGFSANPATQEFRYRISGKQVTLVGITALGTSNATTFTLTGLPAGISPRALVLSAMIVIDNGARLNGRAQISAGTTTVTLFATAAAGNFTASGNKGIDNLILIWEI